MTEAEVVEHPAAVTVVAVDTEGFVTFVRQFRAPTRQWLLELPAGKLDEGEEPAAAARREVEEETGVWGGRVAPAVKVGVAKEIKPDEYRVALTPAGARELVQRGHDVLVETRAGEGSSFLDGAYAAVGARIGSVDEVWEASELLLKVKEPIESEYSRLREGLVLFTYLHIAADERLTRALLDSGITG